MDYRKIMINIQDKKELLDKLTVLKEKGVKQIYSNNTNGLEINIVIDYISNCVIGQYNNEELLKIMYDLITIS